MSTTTKAIKRDLKELEDRLKELRNFLDEVGIQDPKMLYRIVDGLIDDTLPKVQRYRKIVDGLTLIS